MFCITYNLYCDLNFKSRIPSFVILKSNELSVVVFFVILNEYMIMFIVSKAYDRMIFLG